MDITGSIAKRMVESSITVPVYFGGNEIRLNILIDVLYKYFLVRLSLLRSYALLCFCISYFKIQEKKKGVTMALATGGTPATVTPAPSYHLWIAWAAGFAGADAMQVLQASSVAATAGASNLTSTMEGVTAVLNSYGMESDEAMHVADVLFRVVDRGVGSMEELTGSLSNVVGTANAVGVPLEEVGAAIATMTKQGQDMSEATVALNQVFLAFLHKTISPPSGFT